MGRTPLSEPPPRPPRRVLVVGGGPFQLDIIRSGRELGAVVAVVDKNPNAPGLAMADHPRVVDIIDRDAVIEVAREFRADGVVTAASDAALGAVAAVAEALDLPGLRPKTVALCHDKLAMHEAVSAAGLAVPATRLAHGLPEAQDAVRLVGGLPVVVKPRAAAGGRGVSVVRDRAALGPAMTRALAYDANAGALVQRFVGGDALGVESFFLGGKLISAFVMDDQFVSGFVSPVGHTLPSEQPAYIQDHIRSDIEAFASTLGVSDGPANFDVRLEGIHTVLLEVNARLGGNSITDLVRSAYGVDLSGATLRASLGLDPREDLQPRGQSPTASRLILHRGQGLVEIDPGAIAGARDSHVVSFELTVQSGKIPALRVDEHAIVGRCVVRGGDVREAAERARLLAEETLALTTWSTSD